MSIMVDVRGPTYQLPPHRKPLSQLVGRDAPLRPLTQIVPDMSYHQMQIPVAGQQMNPSLHRHSRTSSSSVFPMSPSSAYSPTAASSATYNSSAAAPYYNPNSRRTLSNATASTSTTNTSGSLNPIRTSTSANSVSVSLRRSTSSRSGNTSPSSYVSLMRKQKATVWCDRSQYEDPRLLAQQKAAKMRAAMEVIGATTSQNRISSSGSSSMMGSSMVARAKIRHHGVPKTQGYSAANMVGAGVPMRLSASEVDNDNGSDDDTDSQRTGTYHRRAGSGRSSVGSSRRGTNLRYSQVSRGSSNGDTPPNERSPVGSVPGDLETPVPRGHPRASTGSGDYFASGGGSGGSGASSGESRENSFGRADQMAGPSAQNRTGLQRKNSDYSADELRRRGSVDDRTMTMSGVRLFVANPDLSD